MSGGEALIAQAFVLLVVAVVMGVTVAIAVDTRQKTLGKVCAAIAWVMFAAAIGSVLASIWVEVSA